MTRTRMQLTILIGVVGALAVAAATGLWLADGGANGGDEADALEASAAFSSSDGPGVTDEFQALVPFEASDGEFPSDTGDLAAIRASGNVAVSADGEPAPPNLQSQLDRKIIQSTSVDIDVEEVGRDFQEVIRIAQTFGGFVVSSSFSNADDQQLGDITIRVPGDRYQDVLAQIRGLGEVKQESSDANDVTEEFTDLQARLRTMETTELRLLELMGEAQNINEILQVQDRLDSVRGQIEQVQGRINLLERLTDLATITVHLRPLVGGAQPPVDGGGSGIQPLAAGEAAWERSLDTLRALAAGVLIVGAFSWWLVPPLAVVALATRWWWTRRPGAAAEPMS